jgi:hypothetical protein
MKHARKLLLQKACNIKGIGIFLGLARSLLNHDVTIISRLV